MNLQERLDARRSEFEKKAPKEALDIMHRATEDLRNSGIMERILKIGDTAPDFELKNAVGQSILSRKLLEDGPLVVNFYRGKWWPYCNLELEALQESIAKIESLGATLLMISPQIEEHNRSLIQEKNLSFELVSDPGNQVAQKFGLVHRLPDDLKQLYLKFGINLESANNDDSWTLPIPARYIVDRDAVIRYAEADPDYTVRPDPQHTIEALKSLQS